MILFVI